MSKRKRELSAKDRSEIAHNCLTWQKVKAVVDEWGLDADVFNEDFDMCYCVSRNSPKEVCLPAGLVSSG